MHGSVSDSLLESSITMAYYSIEQTYCHISRIVYYFLSAILTFTIIFSFNVQNPTYNFSTKIPTSGPIQLIPISINSTINQTENPTTKPIVKEANMKYILLWTNDKVSPFVYFGKGQSVFITEQCQWTNCFVTSDRNFLGYYTEFDVIVFNGPQLSIIQKFKDLPSKRSFYQKYVYANIEAASNYPILTDIWDGFFNWTWTYKLNSDATWGYIIVRNSNNKIIGPKINMNWINVNDMDPINDSYKSILRSKKKAAAWFCSNCYTTSRREKFVKEIQSEMRVYNLELDIFGTCGRYRCPKEKERKCFELLRKNYFFYFAFENAFSEDYVTEKIINALNYDTVPVVYGAANYSRFMPEGIYIDALKLGPTKLAKYMNKIISNPELYYRFFRWKKYYSFHTKNESPDTNDYCQFCAMLNNKKLVTLPSIYNRIDLWWNQNNTIFQKQSEVRIARVPNRKVIKNTKF